MLGGGGEFHGNSHGTYPDLQPANEFAWHLPRRINAEIGRSRIYALYDIPCELMRNIPHITPTRVVHALDAGL
jgi:hypothetical protein